MSIALQKTLAVLLLFFGEAVAVSAELVASQRYGLATHSFLSVFLRTLPFMIAGSLLLIVGYILGFAAFRNIWIVTAVSITSILLVEPLLAFLIFKQLPTMGAGLGLFFGVLGLGCALLL